MQRLGLGVQHLLAQFFIPFTFGVALLLLKGILGYRWNNLKAIRAKIAAEIGRDTGPLMICPNHLTIVDSLILVWAMTPFWKALAHPRLFPWNTPEKTKFDKSLTIRFFTYIGKCLPVVRQGTPTQTRTFMEKIKLLLAWGQSLMMFPEGARSLTGRVDTVNYAYGVGKIIDDVRREGLEPRVLLMYLRGEAQTGKSSFPRRHETFDLEVKMIDPRTSSQGLRAGRDLSTQIIQGLAELETLYFSKRT